jgi:branched-chain amino acid transport system permease protein
MSGSAPGSPAPVARSEPKRGSLRAIAALSWPLLSLAAVVTAAALVVTGLSGEVLDRTVITSLVDLIFVVGLYIFVGNSGVFSFGHISFAAIGAYTAAILTIPAHSKNGVPGKDVLLTSVPHFLAQTSVHPIFATLIGGGVAAVFALVLSIPLMRLSGLGASLATLAVLVIVNVVASNWQQITNGTSGIAGVPNSTTMKSALIWALIAMLIAYVFQQTRWCLRLRATREDEVAARAAGIGVFMERRIAFVISAFFVGIGGALYGGFLGSFNPSAFYLTLTFFTVAMLVVGGMTSLAGAVIGVLFIEVVRELLRQIEERSVLTFVPHFIAQPGLREVGLSVIMVLVLILRPTGLTRGQEIPWPPVSRGVVRALTGLRTSAPARRKG